MNAIRGAMIALGLTACVAAVFVLAYYLWEWLL